MSDLPTLRDRIARLILDGVNVEVPSPDTDLFETGVLDSLALVELLVNLESEFSFQISIEEVELERFRSIERIAEFVANRASFNRSSPRGLQEPSARSSSEL